MKEIKRLDVTGINQKFGLATTSASFVFKLLGLTLNRQIEPHRSEMYSLGMVIKGEAELKVGLETYAVQSPGVVAVGPDDVRQWIVHHETLQTISLFFTWSGGEYRTIIEPHI